MLGMHLAFVKALLKCCQVEQVCMAYLAVCEPHVEIDRCHVLKVYCVTDKYNFDLRKNRHNPWHCVVSSPSKKFESCQNTSTKHLSAVLKENFSSN